MELEMKLQEELPAFLNFNNVNQKKLKGISFHFFFKSKNKSLQSDFSSKCLIQLLIVSFKMNMVDSWKFNMK